MATAREFITVPLKKLTVLGQEAPLQTEDAVDALLELNDMMSELAASGVPTGYTKVTALSEEVTIPESMNAAIKNQLTIRMQPYYPESVLTPAFIKAANDSFENLLSQVVEKVTLTMFPTDEEVETATEQNQVIVVEDDT